MHQRDEFPQRAPIPDANFVGTVYHGLPRDLTLTLDPRGGYLAFLGRISPEKGVDRAIEIARLLGIPLKIAAKVDKVDESYFRERIAPLIDQPRLIRVEDNHPPPMLPTSAMT